MLKLCLHNRDDENNHLLLEGRLHTIAKLLAHGLGVTKEHVVVVLEEQGVLHTSIASGHGTLHHNAGLGLPHVKDGHASQGTVGVFQSGGVDNIVGTNNQADIGVGEVLVQLIHFEDNIIWNACFGQQDVQLTRHTACAKREGHSKPPRRPLFYVFALGEAK